MTKSLQERMKTGEIHDDRSVLLYEFISELDSNENGDTLGLTSGGEGDNGEILMYLFDCYFEKLDNTVK